MRKKFLDVLVVLLSFVCVVPFVAQAMPAPDPGNSVVILKSTTGFADPSLEKAKATALGLTVVEMSDVDWLATTTAEFATYNAIIIGDPTCMGLGYPGWLTAEASRAVWGPAVTGNVVVVGTDPTFHSSYAFGGLPGSDGDQVAASGIEFVVDSPGKTGAYIAMSCVYHDTPLGTPVPLLDVFGAFTAMGVGCYNDTHIVAVHDAITGLTDASTSDWFCSVHNAFDSFPPDFLPLVIAEGIGGPGSLMFADGTFGVPYILARGEELSPVACGNGILEVPEECDDGNLLNGDGCSAACKIEVPTNNNPKCSAAYPNPSQLWPPNHKYVLVGVQGVTDPDGDMVIVTVTSVYQDEPLNGLGDGDTSPDAALANPGSVNLRAERAGTKKKPDNGRVYHVAFTADDGMGGSCDGEVTVCVPHDQGKGNVCVDGGPLYNSLTP